MKVSFKTYQRLLKRLLELMVRDFGEDLLACALFGSVARGEGRLDSDVDLIVIIRKGIEYPMELFVKIEKELKKDEEYVRIEKKGCKPEFFPVFFRDDEVGKTPWLFLDIQNHGIILTDREGILKKEFQRLKTRLSELGAMKVVLEDGTWYWDLKPDWKPGEVVEI